MNKQEYLALLTFYSQQLDPAVQSDLLSEVEAHFVFGEQQGKSEEQIARELGDPVEMAKEMVGPAYQTPSLSTSRPAGAAEESMNHVNQYSFYPYNQMGDRSQRYGRSRTKKWMLSALAVCTLLVVGTGLLGVLGVTQFMDAGSADGEGMVRSHMGSSFIDEQAHVMPALMNGDSHDQMHEEGECRSEH